MKLRERGYSLIEMLVTMSLATILMGFAIANLKAYNSSSRNAVSMIQGFVKQARAKAISRTAAYKIQPAANGRSLLTSFANSCTSTTFATDDSLTLELPPGTTVRLPTWTVCLNSRGLSTANVIISLNTTDAGIKQVEVLLGGGTREL